MKKTGRVIGYVFLVLLIFAVPIFFEVICSYLPSWILYTSWSRYFSTLLIVLIAIVIVGISVFITDYKKKKKGNL